MDTKEQNQNIVHLIYRPSSLFEVYDFLHLGQLLHHHHAVVGAFVGLSDQRRERSIQHLACPVHVAAKLCRVVSIGARREKV